MGDVGGIWGQVVAREGMCSLFRCEAFMAECMLACCAVLVEAVADGDSI